jgi:hypothetical protein
MQPRSALTEQNLQCLARPGPGIGVFIVGHAGIVIAQALDLSPAFFSQVVAPFFPHTSTSFVDGWQCAFWRMLPCLTDNHNTLFSFPAFRSCLAVCLSEDTASASASHPLTSFPASRGCSAVYLLEDTASLSHPLLCSRFFRMFGSVLTGGRCIHQLPPLIHLPPLADLAVSSQERCIHTRCSWCWALLDPIWPLG